MTTHFPLCRSTDWKHAKGGLKQGDSVGCDFAGDIVSIGSKVDQEKFDLKEGTAVAGFIRGGAIDNTNGTFQGYVRTLPELVWRVPLEVVTYEDAAAMGGISLSTAVQALYHRLRLPLPGSPSEGTSVSFSTLMCFFTSD